jgi:hypothetical protein
MRGEEMHASDATQYFNVCTVQAPHPLRNLMFSFKSFYKKKIALRLAPQRKSLKMFFTAINTCEDVKRRKIFSEERVLLTTKIKARKKVGRKLTKTCRGRSLNLVDAIWRCADFSQRLQSEAKKKGEKKGKMRKIGAKKLVLVRALETRKSI